MPSWGRHDRVATRYHFILYFFVNLLDNWPSTTIDGVSWVSYLTRSEMKTLRMRFMGNPEKMYIRKCMKIDEYFENLFDKNRQIIGSSSLRRDIIPKRCEESFSSIFTFSYLSEWLFWPFLLSVFLAQPFSQSIPSTLLSPTRFTFEVVDAWTKKKQEKKVPDSSSKQSFISVRHGSTRIRARTWVLPCAIESW